MNTGAPKKLKNRRVLCIPPSFIRSSLYLSPLTLLFQESRFCLPLSYSNKQFTRPSANISLRPSGHHKSLIMRKCVPSIDKQKKLKLTHICAGSNKLMLDFTSPCGLFFTLSEWVPSCGEGARGGSGRRPTSQLLIWIWQAENGSLSSKIPNFLPTHSVKICEWQVNNV